MTQISWSLRLATPEGEAVAGFSVQLQLFDLAAGWKPLAEAVTDKNGRISGKADDNVAKPSVAPMLRLVETASPTALLGGVPRVSAAGAGAVNAEFGDIVRVPEAARPVPKRIGRARAATDSIVVGGVAAEVVALGPASLAASREIDTGVAARDLVTRITTERDELASRLTDAQAELGDVNAKLASRESELKQVASARDALTTQLAAAQAQAAEAGTKLASREAELKQVAIARDALTSQLAAAKAQAGESETRAADLQAQLNASNAKIAKREADLKKLTGARDELAAQLAASQAQAAEGGTREAELRSQLEATNGRLASRDVELKRMSSDRDDLAAQLSASKVELTESASRITDLQARLAEAEAKVATDTLARDAAFAALPTGGSTTNAINLGDFATHIGGEIDSARTALQKSGLSLSNVTVSAKTVLQGGSTMVFPATEDLKILPPGSLSDVGIVFDSKPAAETGDAGVQVPDIRFLTEGAARRVLASVGLVLEVGQGQRGINPDCAPGQAMLQAPASGQSAPRGSSVLAVFAELE